MASNTDVIDIELDRRSFHLVYGYIRIIQESILQREIPNEIKDLCKSFVNNCVKSDDQIKLEKEWNESNRNNHYNWVRIAEYILLQL